MTLSIPLPPETETKLRERAAASGKDLTMLVLEAVEAITGETNGDTAPNGSMPPNQWSAEWRAWAAGHQTLDHVVDDSRESIYAGRGK